MIDGEKGKLKWTRVIVLYGKSSRSTFFLKSTILWWFLHQFSFGPVLTSCITVLCTSMACIHILIYAPPPIKFVLLCQLFLTVTARLTAFGMYYYLIVFNKFIQIQIIPLGSLMAPPKALQVFHRNIKQSLVITMNILKILWQKILTANGTYMSWVLFATVQTITFTRFGVKMFFV